MHKWDEPSWYEKEPNGHVWRTHTYSDGKEVVDRFGLEGGHHHGPICVLCGYAFCEHCEWQKPVPPCPKTRSTDGE